MALKVSRRTVALKLSGAASGALLVSRISSGASGSILNVGGAAISVQIDPAGFDLAPEAILEYVAQCARAVSVYLGRFPVPRAEVQISRLADRGGVGGGRSWGGQTARCRINLGQHATLDDLQRDWVLTHEMFHFAFPSVPEEHHWIEEGLSTYLEPIARAMIGVINPAQVWREMMRDMPRGLPEPGDHGLDNTHTWGRTYWGGALFCLVADVGIRRATQNRFGFRDAIRVINSHGGNITVEWSLAKAWETADQALGTPVLSDLYREMGLAALPTDLPALWSALGVAIVGDHVTFDSQAPLAAIRDGIVVQPGK